MSGDDDDVVVAKAAPTMFEVTIRNDTPWRLQLYAEPDGELMHSLAPLATWVATVTEDEVEQYRPVLDRAQTLGQLSWSDERVGIDDPGFNAFMGFFYAAVPLGIAAAVIGRTLVWILALLVSLAVGGFSYYRARSDEGTWELVGRAHTEFLQYWVLTLTGAVVTATTFLALYHSTDLWRVVQLQAKWPPISVIDSDSDVARRVVVGYGVQLIFVVLAAFLPLYMFFQFDRERLSALRERWVHHVFRADPTIRSRSDLASKYGSHMEDAFGRGSGSHRRLRKVRRSPLVVAAVFLTVGWILVALRMKQPALTFTADGNVSGTVDFETFLIPTPSVLLFAFLGAYFFALHTIVRGYLRRDLQPKTYNVVSSRILVSVILAWMLTSVFSGIEVKVLYSVAFFIGIVPNSFLRAVREFAISLIPSFGGDKGTDEASPLTDLEGIDLYDRTRLGEEGINNIQALATHDLVDLMTTTRIPAPRLIDWMDQALLQLRLGDEPSLDDDAADPAAGVAGSRADIVHRLRRCGVRTASDLLAVYLAAGDDPATQTKLLEMLSDGDPKLPGRLRLMLANLPDEEWFAPIWAWRNSPFVEPEARQRYLDGRSWGLHKDDSPLAPAPPVVPLRIHDAAVVDLTDAANEATAANAATPAAGAPAPTAGTAKP